MGLLVPLQSQKIILSNLRQGRNLLRGVSESEKEYNIYVWKIKSINQWLQVVLN
jgi:hypothetical protein